MMATRPPAALPENGCATLWIRPGQAVFLGPAMNLDPHFGSVTCLAIGVDNTFTVESATSEGEPVRSALIAPRVRHRLRSPGGRMVFCYLDPGSEREQDVRKRITAGDRLVSSGHL